MYTYDRRKVAATMNLHGKWRAITEKHRSAEFKDLQNLLEEAGKYLKSVGLELVVKESYISKEDHGSDGERLSGSLTVIDSPENSFATDTADKVKDRIEEALGIHSYPKLIPGRQGKPRQADDQPTTAWYVDISDY